MSIRPAHLRGDFRRKKRQQQIDPDLLNVSRPRCQTYAKGCNMTQHYRTAAEIFIATEQFNEFRERPKTNSVVDAQSPITLLVHARIACFGKCPVKFRIIAIANKMRGLRRQRPGICVLDGPRSIPPDHRDSIIPSRSQRHQFRIWAMV